MAVTMSIYNRMKANLPNKEIDWEADTIKVALMDNSHSFDADNNTWSDVSANEISGTGYIAGGATLANASVTQDDANDLAKLDGDDIEWSTATFTTYYAVLYDDTVSGDPLIASINFDGAQTVSAGNFTIQWNADGIIEIT